MLRSQKHRPTCYPIVFLEYMYRDWYVSVYVRIDGWDVLTKKRKQHPPPGDDASTRWGRPRQSRERRPRWGTSSKHHTKCWTSSRAGCLWLKTWSKSDFSIAETTWPIYLYTHLLAVGNTKTPYLPNHTCYASAVYLGRILHSRQSFWYQLEKRTSSRATDDVEFRRQCQPLSFRPMQRSICMVIFASNESTADGPAQQQQCSF